MLKFLGNRLLSTIPVLFIVAVLVFLMLRLTPGDPAAVRSYGVRFTRPVVVPDDDKGALVVITAVVGAKNDDGTVRVDITAKSQDVTVLGKAQAVVRLA